MFEIPEKNPKFQLLPYGYYANIKNETIEKEYQKFKEENGIPFHYPMSDEQRMLFDYQMTLLFADEWADKLDYWRRIFRDPNFAPENYLMFTEKVA